MDCSHFRAMYDFSCGADVDGVQQSLPCEVDFDDPCLAVACHHQECPIRLGKFSRMRNHSISKTATAELGRARLACSSINTCAVGPRPDLSSQRCCKLRLKLLHAGGSTGKEDLKADRRVRHYKEVGLQEWPLAGRATILLVLYGISLCMSLRRRTILSKSLRAPAPVDLPFSHGRQNRRSSFCRCRTVREEVRIW